MIFAYEVERCLAGDATLSQKTDAIEHMKLGGFHSNVPTVDQAAFKRWVELVQPLQIVSPVQQTQQMELTV